MLVGSAQDVGWIRIKLDRLLWYFLFLTSLVRRG